MACVHVAVVACELIGRMCGCDKSVVGRQVLAQCNGHSRVSYVMFLKFM